MENQFLSLLQNTSENLDDKEVLYISSKLLAKISKYLEREPPLIRIEQTFEEGWFNKKESYIQKRLKHNRNEGKYCLGISNMYRSYNGKRITRYNLFWLYERDVYYINKEIELEPQSETIPIEILKNYFFIINIDDHKKG